MTKLSKNDGSTCSANLSVRTPSSKSKSKVRTSGPVVSGIIRVASKRVMERLIGISERSNTDAFS